jgi:radical SAM superfamily enzyme YgiQ (UPF0313 family)
VNILLINPATRLKRPTPEFPLGLAYIAASLKEEGNVQVLDNDVERLTIDQFTKRMHQISYDCICLGGIITAFNFQEAICNYVKIVNKDIPVIVGGIGVSCFPELFLQNVPSDIVI